MDKQSFDVRNHRGHVIKRALQVALRQVFARREGFRDEPGARADAKSRRRMVVGTTKHDGLADQAGLWFCFPIIASRIAGEPAIERPAIFQRKDAVAAADHEWKNRPLGHLFVASAGALGLMLWRQQEKRWR